MKYVLAVKRSARSSMPKDWIETLRSIEGVEVLGAEDERATIRASEKAMSKVSEAFGECLHIERAQRFRSE